MLAASLLVALREGLEISLILGIIFSCVRKLGRADAVRYVSLGAASAGAVAILVGAVLYHYTGGEGWSGQPYLEGSVFVAAVVVLSYMTFWMKGHSRSMGDELGGRVSQALDQGGVRQLTFLAFISVIREGIELVMFLLAIALQARGTGPVATGALIGLIIAGAAGWGIYRGTTRINLRLFFKVMGNILIVVAAGLLGNAVHEFIEVGLVAPLGYVFDWTSVLNRDGAIGGILHALVGYSDHPSVLQAALWAAYLIVALVLFNRPLGKDLSGKAPRTAV